MPVLENAADQAYYHQLPTVSFRVIDDKALQTPAGVHSEQYRSYGYNDFTDFERPEYYIRYIEPIEAELRVQVEYDMDEQDQAWLDAVNEERRKDQSGPITYETFEILMDKLEKEWFELIKRIPQPASHLPVEDSKCAVCDDGEGENSNAIVFCDGCNLAVHQDCYGVPYIPEGQWLCRKCTVSPENPVSCLFCPNEGGAFKQTQRGYWSHLLCAIWIPELGLGNAIYMEPVEGVELVPKNRWKLICSLCKERYGACIQCDNRSCFTAFHVTCARQMGLLQGMKSMGSDTQLRAYCHKHLPADARGVFDMDEEDSDYATTPARPKKQKKVGMVTTKSARAHAKSYRPGPPVVPHVIVQSLLDYTGKIAIRKRQAFVERLCRYWSLKREARRGAPLLKRLHLEPWTASTASKQQTDAEKATKLKFLWKLRNDLEKVRSLAEYVKKREKEKLKQTQVIKDVVDSFLFPHFAKLRLVLEKISAMDRTEIFLDPVNQVEIPDYAAVVKEPMCWLWIDDKIERNAYHSVAEFVQDIHLVLDNAMLYNKGDTLYHKTARRIKTNAEPLLDGLSSIPSEAALQWPGEVAEETASGDLEPSRLLLHALLEPDTPENVRDNLASIFAYELEKPGEASPPPPTPKKRKHETHADRKRKREEREALARERRLAGPARTTRQAKAMEDDVKEGGSITADAGARSRSRGVEPDSAVAESSTNKKHRQVGVVGLEVVNHISDKERRKREKAMDLVTEEVGKDDMFKRFNVGWVLAEGSKRERKPRLSEVVKPPAKKRKSEAASSVPSKEKTPSPAPSPLTPVSSLSPATPADRKDKPASRSGRGKSAKEKFQGTPTPAKSATKPRGGNIRKRGQRAETVETADASIIASAGPNRTKSPLSAPPDHSQQSEESEPEEEVEEQNDYVRAAPGTPDTKVKRRARASLSSTAPPPGAGEGNQAVDGAIDEDEGEKEEEDPYPSGTLVWAKLGSYPFFPAEVLDPEDTDANDPIPPSVLANRGDFEKANRASGQRTWLVRFFDAQESYGWIPEQRLDLLLSDDAIDQMYLAGKDRNGRTAKASMKKSLQKAYREACASYEQNAAPADESDNE